LLYAEGISHVSRNMVIHLDVWPCSCTTAW